MSPVLTENLDRDIDLIRKNRGKTAIQTGAEQPPINKIPLDSPALMRITAGGIPIGRITRLWGGPSAGKALSLNTPIPTPDGWTTMGDIKVDDVVFDENGKKCKVKKISEVFYGNDVYEVEFNDGEIIKADKGHLWLTSTRSSRRSALRSTGGGYGGTNKSTYQNSQRKNFDSVKTTYDILQTIKRKDVIDSNNHAIIISKPLDTSEKGLLVDPYILGYWLGDGDSRGAQITVHKDDAYNIIENLEICEEKYTIKEGGKNTQRISFGHLMTCKRGHDLKNRADNGGCHECRKLRKKCECEGKDFFREYPFIHLTTNELLRNIGVMRNKHIPNIYLRSSIDQRWELLKGLMDSDGTADKNGHCSFSSSNKQLMQDFYELVCSLGIKCKISNRHTSFKGKKFPSQIAHFSSAKCPFKLKRKAARWKVPKRGIKHRYIIDIRKINSEPVRCIEVSSDSKLFLVGKAMIPTHNSRLAWLIAKGAQELFAPNFPAGLLVCYHDIEKQYSTEYAELVGIDNEKLLVRDGDIIEDIARELQLLLGSVHVHILDSVSEAKPQDRLNKDAGDWDVGLKIRVWEKAFEYITNSFDKNENSIISISHASKNFQTKSEKALDGKEMEHQSSLSLQMKQTKWLYYDDEGLLQTEDKLKEKGILGIAGSKEADGQEIVVNVSKSRVCTPFRKAHLRLDLHTHQFDHIFEFISAAEYFDKMGGVAHRSGQPAIAHRAAKQGGWVLLPDGDKIQGERALRQRIEQDVDLQRLIRRAMLSGN